MSPDREKPTDLSWVVLDRYLAGQCTPAEQAQVEAWVREHPEEGADLARLRDVLRRATPLPAAPDLDRMWAAVRERRGERETTLPSRVTPPERATRVVGERRAPLERLWRGSDSGRFNRRITAVAALVLVALGAVAVWDEGLGGVHPMPVREFATVAGARSTVTLRDGTQLTLGPATHLRVPANFGQRSRTVELDGEAVFAVVHDARRPFAVRTARGEIRDVGTTFVVRAYAQDSVERVAVAEGEVAMAGASLRANDAAAIDRAGRVTIEHAVDVSRDFGWSHGALVFEDTPLRDAVRELARTYDLTVTIADSALGAKLVTASFSDESVDEVLTTLTRVIGAQYTRSGRAVVIRRGVVPAGAGTHSAADELRMAQRGSGR
jgi:transmembrane sensor